MVESGCQALGLRASASRRHYKLCLRCVAGARGVSECGRKGLSPSSRGGRSRRAAAEYQPGYDGLPGGGGRRPAFTAVRIPRRMARHSSGRRVVAASVPTASAPAPSALAAEYQPGYDGLSGGAQGLRALRIDYDQDHDDDQDFVGFDEARDKVRDET